MHSCYERALKLLALAEHCTRGLERKLLRRGYDEREVTLTLSRLTDEKIIDDRRFADLWIEFRLQRKDEGRRRLAEGLRRRGIDREPADEAARAAAATDKYRACLLRAYGKAREACGGDDAAAVHYLLQKGFTTGEIRACREDSE